MKNTIIAITIVLGINFGAFAQNGNGGLLGYGSVSNWQQEQLFDWSKAGWVIALNNTIGNNPLNLPGGHGLTNDTTAPLGSGALLLIGFGAAYALKKKRK